MLKCSVFNLVKAPFKVYICEYVLHMKTAQHFGLKSPEKVNLNPTVRFVHILLKHGLKQLNIVMERILAFQSGTQ